jgi:hypothetical protein
MTMNEKDIGKKALETAQRIFEGVPNVKVEVAQQVPPTRADLVRPDFVLTINNSNYSHSLAVNVKAQGHPQQLEEAINDLIKYRYLTKRHDDLMVAAPFITKEGAAMCRKYEANYFDLAGNCRISVGGIFIERTGTPNPFEPNPTTPSLYGTRAERILRVLLHEPKKTWKVVPLGEKARTSLGTVSKVRKQLIEHDWAKEGSDGLVLTQPQKLLNDWAAEWARRRVKPATFFTKLPIQELEKRVADFAVKHGPNFALTGTAGAWRRAPMVRPNRTQFYLGGNTYVLDQIFDLKRVTEGANVHVFTARDVGVFDFREMIDGVPVVCPVQLYLDLQHDTARGEEAAKHLYETVIFPDA